MRIALGLSLIVLACDAPAPIKTSSGKRIGSVSLEETFALSNEVRETSFKGDALRSAVASMDKNGVFDLAGTYEAKGALHQSVLTVVIVGTDDKETRIVLKDCAEPHVCAFASDVEQGGGLNHKPAVCRTGTACSRADK